MKVEFRPLKEIIVYEARRYDNPRDLARAVAIQSTKPFYLKWCRGWVFKPYPPRAFDTELYAQQHLNGMLYTGIDYTKMVKFQPFIRGAVENVRVAVLDDTLSEHSNAVADWLDSHKPEL